MNRKLAAITLVTLVWSRLAFCGEIHDAAKAGDLEKVKALLKANPDLVFSKDEHDPAYGGTPLHLAVRYDHKDVVEFLLTSRADVDAKDMYANTPLQWAAMMDDKDLVELLLTNKAEVNVAGLYGWTPLHEAAARGYKDVVKLLLTNKANVNVRNDGGWTPLDLAAFSGNKEMAKLLLQVSNAQYNIYDVTGADDLNKVKALLQTDPKLAYAKAPLGSGSGVTPLHIAAQAGCKDIVELLLEKGANVNATNIINATPLHLAVEHDHKDVAELLRQHGGKDYPLISIPLRTSPLP